MEDNELIDLVAAVLFLDGAMPMRGMAAPKWKKQPEAIKESFRRRARDKIASVKAES